ncbi:hypothetical protein ACLOJK_025931 [Asimina triloba]
MAAPAREEILSLFRSLLRAARSFPDYNIREYTRLRTVDGFRENRSLSDPSSISAAFNDGMSQLEVAKRQAVVYSLYAPKFCRITVRVVRVTAGDVRFQYENMGVVWVTTLESSAQLYQRRSSSSFLFYCSAPLVFKIP